MIRNIGLLIIFLGLLIPPALFAETPAERRKRISNEAKILLDPKSQARSRFHALAERQKLKSIHSLHNSSQTGEKDGLGPMIDVLGRAYEDPELLCEDNSEGCMEASRTDLKLYSDVGRPYTFAIRDAASGSRGVIGSQLFLNSTVQSATELLPTLIATMNAVEPIVGTSVIGALGFAGTTLNNLHNEGIRYKEELRDNPDLGKIIADNVKGCVEELQQLGYGWVDIQLECYNAQFKAPTKKLNKIGGVSGRDGGFEAEDNWHSESRIDHVLSQYNVTKIGDDVVSVVTYLFDNEIFELDIMAQQNPTVYEPVLEDMVYARDDFLVFVGDREFKTKFIEKNGKRTQRINAVKISRQPILQPAEILWYQGKIRYEALLGVLHNRCTSYVSGLSANTNWQSHTPLASRQMKVCDGTSGKACSNKNVLHSPEDYWKFTLSPDTLRKISQVGMEFNAQIGELLWGFFREFAEATDGKIETKECDALDPAKEVYSPEKITGGYIDWTDTTPVINNPTFEQIINVPDWVRYVYQYAVYLAGVDRLRILEQIEMFINQRVSRHSQQSGVLLEAYGLLNEASGFDSIQEGIHSIEMKYYEFLGRLKNVQDKKKRENREV